MPRSDKAQSSDLRGIEIYPQCFTSSDSDIKRSERNGLDVVFRPLKKSENPLAP
ncbi:MAG: hypothetical protein OXF23_01405 [Candidatus Dadabacteria bacterium]|nr:hypothetical protein [Candidatus Dadabacteria bacterium]